MIQRLLHLLLIAALGAASCLAAEEAPAPKKKKKPKSDHSSKITMAIVPGALRYAITQLDVTAGRSYEFTLKNTCIMPHNLVLVRTGQADAVFQQSMELGERGMAQNYVPASPDVLFSFPLVSPGQSATQEFTAPAEPGEYPYLCTFPGHGVVMRGLLRVKLQGEKLEPPVEEKIEGPKLVNALRDSGVTPKPMGTPERPFVLRSFVPNPGLGDAELSHYQHAFPAKLYNVGTGEDEEGKEIPALSAIPCGIAVSFGPNLAYVWDSTECRLLYAWTGGFLEMTPYWGAGTGGSRKGKDYVPLLEGTLVYKAAGPSVLQMGDLAARPKFRGYKLISGNPEFAYEMGGKKIHELIMPADPGSFMVHFQVEQASEPVRLVFDPAIRQQISCDQGSWSGNTLEIPVDHSDRFMLLVKFQPGKTFTVTPAQLQTGKNSEEP